MHHYAPGIEVESNPYEIPVEGKSGTDMETPESIEMEMNATRQSLTEKVAALETQVVGTLHESTAAVQDTVAAVQDTVGSLKTAVEDTVGSVKDAVQTSVTTATDTIKSAFDLSHHVRQNPWMMVGGAVAAGFAAGFLMARNRRRDLHNPYYSPNPYYEPQNRFAAPSTLARPESFSDSVPPRSNLSSSGGSTPSPRTSEPAEPGVFSQISGVFSQIINSLGDEAKKVAESAMVTAADSLKQSINNALPHLIDSAVTGLEEKVYSQHADDSRNGANYENRPAAYAGSVSRV